MHIGIPREIKVLEGRVGLVPEAAGDLVHRGHQVSLESGAGVLSGYADAAYEQLGVKIVPTAADLYAGAELIVKVKEPQAAELPYLRRHHLLFCYLHLAAIPQLARQLLDIGLTAVAFETVEGQAGDLPLLAPMSDIAGRLSVQIGANLLQRPARGKGLLLGGLPAAPRGHVVVIGGGTVGFNAAAMAARIGAQVTVFDRKRHKLEALRALGDNVTALYSYHDSLEEEVARADLLVGAVLVTGHRAPHLVTEEMVASMGPGSVIVDVAVDQGGCIATTRPTTYENPTYIEHDVVHFGVTNMPGAVPRSASQALSAALIPWLHRLTEPDWQQDRGLRAGINLMGGELVHPALKEDLSF
jgi:alanine dehydrogenase